MRNELVVSSTAFAQRAESAGVTEPSPGSTKTLHQNFPISFPSRSFAWGSWQKKKRKEKTTIKGKAVSRK